ncbi:MAG: lipopolysaccharide transport periplasmic protein LptA [Burkholderiales bacterium]|nr:MAG: lipopolysaccharide transport periplasmic protein LptA [Burkholderiales bacterium]TAG79055.1 MAG: lipopolysaccharide transport periplasmic protein LptA [Betaproteobacteria bacterium]
MKLEPISIPTSTSCAAVTRKIVGGVVASAVAAAVFAPAAFAERADRTQKVNINSIDFEGDQGKGVYKLSRNVTVKQGTLKITADRADIRTTEDEQYFAVLTAKPVCFRQRTDQGNWAQGVAERVEYDSARGIVELYGNAILFVGDDETRASYIVYNTQANTFEARDSKDRKAAGKGVTFVLQPRERDEKPAAPPATSAETTPSTTAMPAPPAPRSAPRVVQPNPPKRNEPAFSRCA